jgi:hypothetical protein
VSFAIETGPLGTPYPQFPPCSSRTASSAVSTNTPIFFNLAKNIYQMVAVTGTVSATLIIESKAIPPSKSLFLGGHPNTIGKSTSHTLYVTLRTARVHTRVCKAVQKPSSQADNRES